MHKIEFQDYFIHGLVNESTIVVDKNSVTQIIEVDRLNHIATPVFFNGENVTLFGCQHASSNGNYRVNELTFREYQHAFQRQLALSLQLKHMVKMSLYST